MKGSVKQVIVMRKDLNMRRGKEIAQGAHASQAWLLKKIDEHYQKDPAYVEFTIPEQIWLAGPVTKICVRVDSEEALMEVYENAQKAGILVHLITDAGATEFHGVPTRTCLAIGPFWSDAIDKITGDKEKYKLY